MTGLTPAGEDELGQLAYAFNLMATDLSKMYTDLEQRVADKTADLERSNRSLELLYATTQQLGEQSLTVSVLESLLREIERLLDVRGGAVCLGSVGDSQAFRMASTLEPVTLDGMPCSGAQCLKCFGHGEAHTLVDEVGQPRRYSVPIREQAQQYGILTVELAPDTELQGWQQRLLASVASHIAMAIVRARQSSQQRLLALMEERSVIARELHDSLAQSLSYLKIQVSRLDNILADADNPKVHEITAKLRDGLNNAYRELRELLTTFRLRISEEGLLHALEETVNEYRERGGFAIELDNHIPNFQFSPNVEIHIVQLIREALSNVVRHAGASRAVITLRSDPGGNMTILVEDDGKGMPDIESLEHHHGLPIMRERAKSIGGLLHIGTSALGGTAVRLTFKPTDISLE